MTSKPESTQPLPMPVDPNACPAGGAHVWEDSAYLGKLNPTGKAIEGCPKCQTIREK